MVGQQTQRVKLARGSMHVVRRIAISLVVFVLAAGCGQAHLVRTNQKVGSQKLIDQVSASPPSSTGGVPAPKATAHFTAPLLVVQLKDHNGKHPAGIPVRVSGAVNAVELSDANGEMEFFQAGTYRFDVVSGCGASVIVFGGGSATAGAVDGRTQQGSLDVDWQHRITPAPPVFSNPSPPWPIGKDVTVQFDSLDRCTQKFAPNAPYPTFTFATSPNLRVSTPPVLRSNAKSQGFVTVRCAAKGAVTLVAFDTANPKDNFNVARESSDYSPPSCG